MSWNEHGLWLASLQISGFLMRDHGSRMDAFWASAGRLDDTTREKMITSSLLGGLLAAGKELHRSRGLQDLVEALVALSARRGAAECSGDGTYEVHLNDVGRSLLNLVLRHYGAPPFLP